MLPASAIVFGLTYTLAMTSAPPDTARLLESIDALSGSTSVLYVAAHPDDENTELLSWLVNSQSSRAAYLSLTRGEGGQNLIGSERAPWLGVIRTQELLAARRIDGAEQFFGNLRDFGFSKNPEETLRIWGHDAALSDVVWAIRRFQPDVIVTRFSPESAGKTHGHHTASALLAVEAFSAAADPTRFPEQLAAGQSSHAEPRQAKPLELQPWQAHRIVWNRGSFGQPVGTDLSGFVAIEVGNYNPRLGQSVGEIAAASRSMHKSQGFGDSPDRGSATEYFQWLGGAKMVGSPFTDLPNRFTAMPGAEQFLLLAKKLRQEFQPDHPEASLPGLFACREQLKKLAPSPLIVGKIARTESLIAAVSGLFVATTSEPSAGAPDAAATLTLTAVQRTLPKLQLESVSVGGNRYAVDAPLLPTQVWSVNKTFTLAKETPLTNPYWLVNEPAEGRFNSEDPRSRGLPEDEASLQATFNFSYKDAAKITPNGTASGLSVTVPVEHVWTDPVAGERRRRFAILPQVTVRAASPVVVFGDAKEKKLSLTLRATNGAARGVVQFEAPEGFKVTPAKVPFELASREQEQSVEVRVRPSKALEHRDEAYSGLLSVKIDGEKARQMVSIDHPHIPVQILTPVLAVKLVRFELNRAVSRIGYVPGAGDDVAAALSEAGYEVTILGGGALQRALEPPVSLNAPGSFEAIVLGVRAFNTNVDLIAAIPKLNAYVERGGTVVCQYNTQNARGALVLPGWAAIGPKPFTISRDRVTDEAAKVRFLLPQHPLLTSPNKLTERDFVGWVQERGLYFANPFDAAYEAPLGLNDPGESEKRGGLITLKHGKGRFIYTGLAFFRQLPAGVPGAYRLFANLLTRER